MRGLLVDYGGVLTTSVVDSFVAFCDDEGIDPVVFREAVIDAARTPESPVTRVEIGAIGIDEFDAELARVLSDACGRAVDPARLTRRLFATVRPDGAMTGAVRAARFAGVRTGLVSNSWSRDYPFEEFRDLFDATVISGEVGIRKPDREIYLLAAKTIGLPPRECVFVDDFRRNVEGARAVGMAGVVHRATEDTIAELEALLGVPLRG